MRSAAIQRDDGVKGPLLVGHERINDAGIGFGSTLTYDVRDSLRVGQYSFVHAMRDQGIADIRFCSEAELRPGSRALLHFDEITGLPRSVKRRLLRSIDAEVSEPAFSGNGLDPLALVAGGRLGAEVKVDG